MRGHGDSEKVDHGYRIPRLARDVYDLLQGLGLTDVTLLGHSMGCSVIWCYLDLYQQERIKKLILVDQAPFVTSNPAWSDEERKCAGSLFDSEALLQTCNAIGGPDGEAATRQLFNGTFTKSSADAEE
jgi:pimeloyl-ACP methyl ester carboxylesterase